MILFYNPISNVPRRPHLPISLLAVAAGLDGGIPYKILDAHTPGFSDHDLLSEIRTSNAKMLAVTVMPGPQVGHAARVCRTARDTFPELTIVWGGYFPTLYPRAAISNTFVDFCFRGHADHGFPGFARAVLAGQFPEATPGLVWLDRESGAYRDNPPARLPVVEALPPLPYEAVDMEIYVRPTYLGRRTLGHNLSYGCPFACNFCGVVNMVGGRFSELPAEAAVRSVAELVKRHDLDSMVFYDNNFFVGEKRAGDFCRGICDLDISWWAFGRADTLMIYSDETWRAMRRSGLKMVFVGAESSSEETLKRMNKGGKQTPDTVLRLVEKMARFGIVPELSFMVGNPPDPKSDFEQTVQFIRRIKSINPDTETILFAYSPVPSDGEMMAEARKYGFEIPDSLELLAGEEWQRIMSRREANLPWVAADLRARIKNYKLTLDSAFPTVTDRSLPPAKRALIRLAGLWRYKLGFYACPYDLRLINKLMPHQRPETSGF